MTQSFLVDAEDSVLVAIDVQDHFLQKLSSELRRQLLTRIQWLLRVAQWLQIPIVATAEDIDVLGSISGELAPFLPAETTIHNKMVFGLAEDLVILSTIEATGRKTAVLVGLETDVCVAHSALGLMARDYRVAVIADATRSAGEGHATGLERIRGAGGLILSVKSLFYEWLPTVSRVQQFEAANRDLQPPTGLVL